MTDFDPISAGFRLFVVRDRRNSIADLDLTRSYVTDFACRLPGRNRRANRVLREIEDHLEEVADQLCRQGMEPAAAAAAAIRRFGTLDDVIHEFELQAPFESEENKVMRILLTPIIALTTLFAGLMFLFAWFDDAPTPVLAMKVVLSAVVIGYNLLLLHYIWFAKASGPWERWLAVGAALTSIMMGSAILVWTAHLGLVTGDFESYCAVGGCLLMLQGVLATLHILVTHAPSQVRPA